MDGPPCADLPPTTTTTINTPVKKEQKYNKKKLINIRLGGDGAPSPSLWERVLLLLRDAGSLLCIDRAKCETY